MAITFPSSPSNGQKFTSGNKSWTWNGSSWIGTTTTGGDAATLGGISASSFLRSDTDDGTTGKLGIGTTSPQGALHVTGGPALIGVSDDWHQSSQSSVGTTIIRGGYRTTTIDNNTTALKIYNAATNVNKTANNYGNGIGFMHLDAETYGSGYTGQHAWIGLKIVDTPAQERSSLVFATNNNTAAGSHPTEKMVIRPDGNVGIGTTPSRLLHIASNSANNADPYLLIDGSNSNRDSGIIINAGAGEKKVVRGDVGGNLYFGNSNQIGVYNNGNITVNPSGANVDFTVECNGNSNAIFLDSSEQRLYFGNNTTGQNTSESVYIDVEPGNRHVFFAGNGREVLYVNRNGAAGTAQVFRANNVQVGGIAVNSSGTTYNTTSDRRLKDNIQPISDATDKLMDMKPVTHTWIDNPDNPKVHGFIAQEMQEVIPEAVSGDAESDEMMSMDYGRITPVIVAALQDALNEIKELKTRINELENK